MKEIKVRVWNKNEERMEKSLCGWLNVFPKRIVFDNKDVEVMLFTGYKDKNGKEICEGDFIINTDSFDTLFHRKLGCQQFTEIIFEKGCFFSRIKDEQDALFEKDLTNYKIIGNIYEDSHLLSDNVKNVNLETGK